MVPVRPVYESSTPMSQIPIRAIVIFATALSVVGTACADWTYRSEIDIITGQSSKMAVITSSKSLNLKFPYSGTNFGSITVRQKPRQDLAVTFSVDVGQLACDAYSGCSINVRFDDAPAVTFNLYGLIPRPLGRYSDV